MLSLTMGIVALPFGYEGFTFGNATLTLNAGDIYKIIYLSVVF